MGVYNNTVSRLDIIREVIMIMTNYVSDELANKVKGKANVYKIESAKYPAITSFPKAKIVKGKKVVKDIDGGGQSVEELSKSLLSFGGKRTRRRYTRRFVRRTGKRQQ